MNDTTLRGPGILWLLRPKIRSKLHRTKSEEGHLFKWGVLAFVGLFFWSFIFVVIFRMLLYFRGTQGIGDLLAWKLLGLALLTFLMILLLSNVITALSTYFLSEGHGAPRGFARGLREALRGTARGDDRGFLLDGGAPGGLRSGVRSRMVLLRSRRRHADPRTW